MNKFEIKWWGYRHVSGDLILKRYFDQKDIEEAHESPFVEEVFGPVSAMSKAEAIVMITHSSQRPCTS